MRATCNSCDHQFSVSSNVSGKRVRCPECGEAVRVSEGDDGPSRSSSRSKKSRGRSSGGDQTGLLIGAGIGGAAIVGILVFVLTRGSTPLPPPPDQPTAGAAAQMSTPASTPTATMPGTPSTAQANTVPVGAQNPDGLPTTMIQQLKDATVFIKTEIGPIAMSGSGFVMEVTGDSALIVTNHHVIAKPKELSVGGFIPGLRGRDRIALSKLQSALANAEPVVSVVFNSGAANEQTIKSEVLGGVEDPDVAILKVSGIKAPPKAIEFRQVPAPVETMALYVLGFPFGDALSNNKGNPSITIGKASVSSIRNDAAGKLDKIQIDGALNPGNSGGPIVDMKGNLVGIAVQTIQGSNIGIAIPPSDLLGVLEGQVGKPQIVVGKIENGGTPTYEIVVPLIDPLKKLRGVSIQYFDGAAPIDASKIGQPQLQTIAGSNAINLNVSDRIARAPLQLTPNSEPRPRDVTVQASYFNQQGQQVHLDPIIVKVAPPVVVSTTTTTGQNGGTTISQTQTSGGRTIRREITINGGAPSKPDNSNDTPKSNNSTTATTKKGSTDKKDDKDAGSPGAAVWTNKIATMKKIPNEEVSGKIDGVDFTLDRAELTNGTLTLTKTPRFRGVFAEAEVRVVLFLKSGEDVSGRKIIVNGFRGGDPHVQLSAMREKDKLPTTISGFDFLLVLEFGQYDIDNKVQPGKIYVCTPDRGKSFVAGTFEADVR